MNENDSDFDGKPDHPLTGQADSTALRDAQLAEINSIADVANYDWESLTSRHRLAWEALYAKYGMDY